MSCMGPGAGWAAGDGGMEGRVERGQQGPCGPEVSSPARGQRQPPIRNDSANLSAEKISFFALKDTILH